MYPTEFVPDPEIESKHSVTYGEAVKSVATSAVDLIHKELNLVREEFKESLKKVREHLLQAVLFGALLFISALPLIAFLVIGLGELLEHRYWLSSLIVGVLCAAIGGGLAYRAGKKIREEDINFTRTKNSLEQAARTFERKFNKVKTTATGGRYGKAHSV